jgi:hypothetical protein
MFLCNLLLHCLYLYFGNNTQLVGVVVKGPVLGLGQEQVMEQVQGQEKVMDQELMKVVLVEPWV